MKILNRNDAPCDDVDNGSQINLEKCITTGVEEKLNCTIPDMSSGQVEAPVGKVYERLCSSKEEFLQYVYFDDMNRYTELQLSRDFGCTRSCQRRKYDLK